MRSAVRRPCGRDSHASPSGRSSASSRRRGSKAGSCTGGRLSRALARRSSMLKPDWALRFALVTRRSRSPTGRRVGGSSRSSGMSWFSPIAMDASNRGRWIGGNSARPASTTPEVTRCEGTTREAVAIDMRLADEGQTRWLEAAGIRGSRPGTLVARRPPGTDATSCGPEHVSRLATNADGRTGVLGASGGRKQEAPSARTAP